MTDKFQCPRRAELGVDPAIFKVAEFDVWTTDRKCTWCGSLHPDDLMAYIKSGKSITPTDKTYKIYLEDHQKFYFQHLDNNQMYEFINLYNDRKINIGYPGYFYVVPFFMEIISGTRH